MAIAERLQQALGELPDFAVYHSHDKTDALRQRRECLDSLICLDKSGWAANLETLGFPPDYIHSCEEVVGRWLSQEDYRRLSELAAARYRRGAFTEDVPRSAAEHLVAEWLTEDDFLRLSDSVATVGWEPRMYRVCYALSRAVDAAQSALSLAGLRPFTTYEIAEAIVGLQESADEYAALAAEGL